jgi:hypothetical protein
MAHKLDAKGLDVVPCANAMEEASDGDDCMCFIRLRRSLSPREGVDVEVWRRVSHYRKWYVSIAIEIQYVVMIYGTIH